jgi:hypothetical protein
MQRLDRVREHFSPSSELNRTFLNTTSEDFLHSSREPFLTQQKIDNELASGRSTFQRKTSVQSPTVMAALDSIKAGRQSGQLL